MNESSDMKKLIQRKIWIKVEFNTAFGLEIEES